MKYLIFCFLLTGCSVKGINSTLFLKEDGSRLYNLDGQDCLESGYKISKMPDGHYYRIVTYYKNCDIHKERQMEEFEPRQWGIKEKLDLKLK